MRSRVEERLRHEHRRRTAVRRVRNATRALHGTHHAAFLGVVSRYVEPAADLDCPSCSLCTARASILAFLQDAIQVGQLVLVDYEGTHTFGTYANGANYVQVRVADDQFWQRVFVSGDLGCAHLLLVYPAQRA